jgi:hypothetical protein
MTQCERIVAYIHEYGSITTMQAFTDLGIARLASRIHDLQDMGYQITRESIQVKNRYGEAVRCTRYSLMEDGNGSV